MAWRLPPSPLLLAAVVLLAGCAGSAKGAEKTRFHDADIRFEETSKGSFSVTRYFQVPQNTTLLTVKYALQSPAGAYVTVQDPGAHRSSARAFPLGVNVTSEQWQMRATAGNWSVRISCDGGCHYVFSVYYADAIKFNGPSVGKRYADASIHVASQEAGGAHRVQKLGVPDHTKSLRVFMSWDANDGFAYRLTDPVITQPQLSASYDLDSSVTDAKLVLAQPPRPGNWTLTVDCAAACQYVFGFYVV